MSEPFVGEIKMVGFNFAPRGWSTCDGQLLNISQNTALFSLLGTAFGGDGRTTFGLPRMRGRVPVHVGSGAGIAPVSWGELGGANTHNLTTNQLPSHNHTASSTLHMSDLPGDRIEGEGNYVARDADNATSFRSGAVRIRDMDAGSVTTTVDNTGNGQAFSLMQPFIGIYFVIALVGVYPSQ